MKFSQTTLDLFRRKKFQGLIHSPDASAHAGSFKTGRFAVIGLKCSDNVLTEARYRTFPCVFAIALAEWLCEWAYQRTWSQIEALQVSDLESAVEGLPLSRRFCAHLVLDAFKAAALQAHQKGILT